MKITRLEPEQSHMGRKPKKPRLDQKTIAKIGNTLYHVDDVRSISIKVRYKNGTATTFNRSEDEDRFERIKEKMDRDEEEDNDDE
jgi:hypothetical protein